MISIILDTNLLYSKSNNYTIARFTEKLEDVIEQLEVNDFYDKVKVVIPQIVVNELLKQQIDDGYAAIKLLKGYKINESEIEFPENYKEQCIRIFDDSLNKLKEKMVKIEIAPYPSDSSLTRIINRAINKAAPFEGKDKESDKGFKDVLIWESVLAYKKLHIDERIVLYTRDIKLSDESLKKEFFDIFNEDINLLYRNDTNSHNELIDLLSNLLSIENERIITIAQQLRNILLSKISFIFDSTILSDSNSFEYKEERFYVEQYYLRDIDIVQENEDDNVITYFLNISVEFEGMNLIEEKHLRFGVDFRVTTHFDKEMKQFYLKSIENPDINGYEFADLGLILD